MGRRLGHLKRPRGPISAGKAHRLARPRRQPAPSTGINTDEHARGEASREAIARAVKAQLAQTRELLHGNGELVPGRGRVSSVIALSLGFLCLLAVLAFHFPQNLTTPDLRHKSAVDVLRQVAGRPAGG